MNPVPQGGSGTAGEPATSSREPRTEIRLALVMNGGVSLAVWMGGVAHELDLLRRASLPDSDDSDVAELDKPVFRLWKELAEESRVQVVIDIISGTSAGGINGLLLATSIARDSPLANLRRLWRTSASLDQLQKGRPKNSVLNGRYFERKISEALKEMPESNDVNTSGSRPDPITLFVTATALDGRSRRYKDSLGQSFEVNDHRRLYRFENRPNSARGEHSPDHGPRDFTERNDEVLKLAARATAGFPIAFQPVSELPLLEHRVIPETPAGASNVMDGGVLNNEPFGPVLDAITRRKASRTPVERVLIYIVPSGGQVANERVRDLRCDEISWATAGWSGLNYPQEVNFRASMEEISNRLQTSGSLARDELFSRLLGEILGPSPDEQVESHVTTAALSLLGEYRRSRVKAVLLSPRPAGRHTEEVTRLDCLPETSSGTIHSILAENFCWYPPGTEDAVLRPDMVTWTWGLIVAERVLQCLGNFMQVKFLTESGDGDPVGRGRTADAVETVDACLIDVMAIMDEVVAEQDRRRPRGDVASSDHEIAALVQQVFSDLRVPERVGERIATAVERCHLALRPRPGAVWDTGRLLSTCLKVEILTQAFAPPALALAKLTPRFRFLRMGPDAVGPLFDEDWSRELGDRKLYGTRFRHFGAFVSSDWRRSDFAWGRLDAAHHMLPLFRKEYREVEVHHAILAAETRETGESAAEKMRVRLKDLKNKTDAQLLDDDGAKSLKNAGDTTIRMALGDRFVLRTSLLAAWAVVWESWKREERPEPRKIGMALARPWIVATAAAAVLTVLLFLGIVLATLLLVACDNDAPTGATLRAPRSEPGTGTGQLAVRGSAPGRR
ncbi:patatin-like protein [Streptomyces sp. NPDC102282]|uniref:patatin-like protein n=1 Tax=Streptomyces sp. NPDC102282 TaxID=3366154 RepID=UPI00382479D9